MKKVPSQIPTEFLIDPKLHFKA